MGEKSNILWCKILYDVKYFTPQVETLTNYNLYDILHHKYYITFSFVKLFDTII